MRRQHALLFLSYAAVCDGKSAEAHHHGLQDASCAGYEVGVCASFCLGYHSKRWVEVRYVGVFEEVRGFVGISKT